MEQVGERVKREEPVQGVREARKRWGLHEKGEWVDEQKPKRQILTWTSQQTLCCRRTGGRCGIQGAGWGCSWGMWG